MTELRKLPKITDGILLITQTITGTFPGDARLVEYAPGNGTRYVLVVVDLTSLGEDLPRMGRTADEPCHLVAWVNGGSGKAMTVGAGFLHYRYVGEKLDCGTPDAVVLAELIGWLCKLDAVSCEDFKAGKG